MSPKKKTTTAKETPREGVRIRLPGFEFTSTGRLTTITVILLVIALLFLLAIYMIFFFHLPSIEKFS
jgi:hypothetical protein